MQNIVKFYTSFFFYVLLLWVKLDREWGIVIATGRGRRRSLCAWLDIDRGWPVLCTRSSVLLARTSNYSAPLSSHSGFNARAMRASPQSSGFFFH